MALGKLGARGGFGSGGSLAKARKVYDPAAQAFFDRAAVQPDAARKDVYNNYFIGLRSSGLLAKGAILNLAGADSQITRQNLTQNLYNLIAVASPQFTADRGFTGDGSSSYLSTNTATNAVAGIDLNSCSAFTWSFTDANLAAGYDLGGSTSNAFGVRGRAGGNLACNGNNGTASAISTPNSLGFYGWSRNTSTSGAIYKNGANVMAISTTSIALTTSVLELLHSLGGYSSRQLGFYWIGAGLTDIEVSSLYSLTQTYLQAIGAPA